MSMSMSKPYLFDDPSRILSAKWTEFAAACFEYEIPTDTAALSVIGVYLDAAELSPLVAAVKARWEVSGTLIEAVKAVGAGALSPADAMRVYNLLEWQQL